MRKIRNFIEAAFGLKFGVNLTHSNQARKDANVKIYNFAKKAAHKKPKCHWKMNSFT